ncbi:hypothetical protein KCU95_g10052, partial [Aureobasidium melanogenum]
MDQHQGHASSSHQAQAPSSPQAQTTSSRQGHAQSFRQAPALPSADRPDRQGQPQAPRSSITQQHPVPHPDYVPARTMQMQDRELPDGDLTGSILWPRAHITMIDKNDIALAQNEVIMQKLLANEQLMKEQQKVTNRQFNQIFGLLQAVGNKVGVDPTIILNAKPSSKSTMTAKREAAKTIATDIDPALKVSIINASKKYLQEFPGLMLKTITQKAKNEDYVGKWAAFVERSLQSHEQHLTAFSRLDKVEKESLYKETANEIRPSTKKVNKAVLSDRSDEEGQDETTNAIRSTRTRKTRKPMSEGQAPRKRPRLEEEEEDAEDDTYDGSTLVDPDSEDDEEYEGPH